VLRAAPGSLPRFVQAADYDEKKYWLTAWGKSLRMEGLEWSGGGWQYWFGAGMECVFHRCRLLKTPATDGGEAGAIIKFEGTKLTLTDCVLFASVVSSAVVMEKAGPGSSAEI